MQLAENIGIHLH